MSAHMHNRSEVPVLTGIHTEENIPTTRVRMTGTGWLTELQAATPGFRGPVIGREYPCEPRTPKTVTVKLDGYSWPVWINNPDDQFGGVLI